MGLNPEFLRNVRIQLTPRRALFATGLTVTLIIIGGMLVWFSVDPYSRMGFDVRLREFGDTCFALLVFAQFGLLHVMASGAAGGSIVQERVRGTLLFQQMTLLSPHEMLLGKLFGSTILYYFLAAVIMPFAIISAFLAGMDSSLFISTYALLIIGGLCWQALALYVSAAIASSTDSAGRNYMGMGYSVGGLAGLISLSTSPAILHLENRDEIVHFYGVPLPAIIVALGLMVFIGGWAYIGAVRAFKQLQLITLSPRPVWYFFASLEALLVGLLWKGYFLNVSGSSFSQSDLIVVVIFFLVINWIALTVLAGTSAIGRNQLREWWSAERDSTSVWKRAEIRNAVLAYPIAVCISIAGLKALWMSLWLRAQQITTGQDFNFIYMFVVSGIAFLATMAAMAGFIQFWSMHRFRVANQAGVALWVLLFIILGIAAAVVGEKSLVALLNPLILIGSAFDNRANPAISQFLVLKGLIVECSFAACCLGLAYWKFRRTHREMN
jgi:hypothetical protein